MAKLGRFIVPGLVSVLFACPGMFPAMASGNSGLYGILATLDVEKAADMGNRYLKRNNPDASVRPDSALVCFEEVVSRYDVGREKVRPETLIVALSNMAYIYSCYISVH